MAVTGGYDNRARGGDTSTYATTEILQKIMEIIGCKKNQNYILENRQ